MSQTKARNAVFPPKNSHFWRSPKSETARSQRGDGEFQPTCLSGRLSVKSSSTAPGKFYRTTPERNCGIRRRSSHSTADCSFPVLHSVVDCEWDQPLRISKILSQVSVTHNWTSSQTDRSRSFRIILPRCFSIVLILRFNSEAITLLGNPPVTIRPPCRAAKTDIVKTRKTQPHSKNALLRNLFAGLLTATGLHPLIRRAARQKIGPFARASLVLATAVFDVLCNPLLFQITVTQHSFGF